MLEQNKENTRSVQNKVFIETYGCQMNVLDSELVKGQLESQGYEFVEDSDNADVVLLNTCSVRELSEHKVWSRLCCPKRVKDSVVCKGLKTPSSAKG